MASVPPSLVPASPLPLADPVALVDVPFPPLEFDPLLVADPVALLDALLPVLEVEALPLAFQVLPRFAVVVPFPPGLLLHATRLTVATRLRNAARGSHGKALLASLAIQGRLRFRPALVVRRVQRDIAVTDAPHAHRLLRLMANVRRARRAAAGHATFAGAAPVARAIIQPTALPMASRKDANERRPAFTVERAADADRRPRPRGSAFPAPRDDARGNRRGQGNENSARSNS